MFEFDHKMIITQGSEKSFGVVFSIVFLIVANYFEKIINDLMSEK